MVAVALSVFIPEATVVAGALTLCAALIGLAIVRGAQFAIALALMAAGAGALLVAVWLGYDGSAGELLSFNQDLIAMLAAVSFIQLIAAPDQAAASRLFGAGAVWRTAGAIHLLGSVINVSALNIIGDRLGKGNPLTHANAMLLSRSFSPGAFWSPFWGAAAAAIAYAPGAKVNILMLCGASLAALALAYSINGVVRSFGPELSLYRGYVLTWRTLRVPLALVTVVLAAHALAPNVPIPRVVLLSSIAMTGLVLLVTRGAASPRILAGHAARELPRLSRELTLFASAGLLAVGLGALVAMLELDLAIDGFGVWEAWLCTLAMALLSLVGVHPVISIAFIAVLIAPLAPDPTLYAMASMIAWGASAAAGPISGLNIYLNGRFNADNFAVARANLPYLVVVLALAWPTLWMCAQLA